jgi:hypothetical protein
MVIHTCHHCRVLLHCLLAASMQHFASN